MAVTRWQIHLYDLIACGFNDVALPDDEAFVLA